MEYPTFQSFPWLQKMDQEMVERVVEIFERRSFWIPEIEREILRAAFRESG